MKIMNYFHNKKVLDLGCGTGEVDIVLNYFGAKCYGIDLISYL